MTPRELGRLAGMVDVLEADLQSLREWLADCTQPALAEPKMSREFCRCERCSERRERRSGVERRVPFALTSDWLAAGHANGFRRLTSEYVKLPDGRFKQLGRRAGERS